MSSSNRESPTGAIPEVEPARPRETSPMGNPATTHNVLIVPYPHGERLLPFCLASSRVPSATVVCNADKWAHSKVINQDNKKNGFFLGKWGIIADVFEYFNDAIVEFRVIYEQDGWAIWQQDVITKSED